jgi:hypothetical protein
MLAPRENRIRTKTEPVSQPFGPDTPSERRDANIGGMRPRVACSEHRGNRPVARSASSRRISHDEGRIDGNQNWPTKVRLQPSADLIVRNHGGRVDNLPFDHDRQPGPISRNPRQIHADEPHGRYRTPVRRPMIH